MSGTFEQDLEAWGFPTWPVWMWTAYFAGILALVWLAAWFVQRMEERDV